MVLVNGLREIIYPKPISKDNNVKILSFCIYNIINKYVVTCLNPVVISC